MRNLKSIPDCAKIYPLSEGQFRWHVFNAQANGLGKSGAVVRIGRRVFIDTDRFDAWIDSQQHRHQAKAA